LSKDTRYHLLTCYGVSGASDGLIRQTWYRVSGASDRLIRQTWYRVSGTSDGLIHLRGQWRQRPLDLTDLVRKTVQRADRVLESGASDRLIRQTCYWVSGTSDGLTRMSTPQNQSTTPLQAMNSKRLPVTQRPPARIVRRASVAPAARQMSGVAK